MYFFKWKKNGIKTTSFYSRTWINVTNPLKYAQNFLYNDHFTYNIIQKVKKNKLVNNYRAYVTKNIKWEKWNITAYTY